MKKTLFIVLALFAGLSFTSVQRPVLYIIGDSTVRNGSGIGSNGQWGWGSFIASHFDTTKISISNQAIGGRSSRTFITEGRWDKVLSTLKNGDYVMIQFGHNDAGPLADTARARGTIRGIGSDSVQIYNPIRKEQEIVHTYGWYMRKYVRDVQAKGAVAIICSPIPRNDWKDGQIVRSSDSYARWAEQIAKEEGAYFINLNELVARRYEMLGEAQVKLFFPSDHTHTDIEGARLNAAIVVESVKKIKPGRLQKYLLNKYH